MLSLRKSEKARKKMISVSSHRLPSSTTIWLQAPTEESAIKKLGCALAWNQWALATGTVAKDSAAIAVSPARL